MFYHLDIICRVLNNLVISSQCIYLYIPEQVFTNALCEMNPTYLSGFSYREEVGGTGIHQCH